MADLTFQSQQFAADQAARGAGYQLAGADAIQHDLPQAPQSYMRMRAAAIQETADRSEIALRTAQTQDLQNRLLTTQQLQAMGSTKLQMDAMKMANELQQIQLEQAREAQQGKFNVRDLARAATAVTDEHGLPRLIGDNLVLSLDPKTRTYGTRAQTEEEKAQRAEVARRGYSHADPDELELERQKLEFQKQQGAAKAAAGTQTLDLNRTKARLQAWKAKYPYGGSDKDGSNAELDAILNDLTPEGSRSIPPAPQPAQRQGGWFDQVADSAALAISVANSPKLGPLFSGEDRENAQLNQQAFRLFAEERARKRGMSFGQAASDLARELSTDEASMRAFLKARRFPEDQIDLYMRERWKQ